MPSNTVTFSLGDSTFLSFLLIPSVSPPFSVSFLVCLLRSFLVVVLHFPPVLVWSHSVPFPLGLMSSISSISLSFPDSDCASSSIISVKGVYRLPLSPPPSPVCHRRVLYSCHLRCLSSSSLRSGHSLVSSLRLPRVRLALDFLLVG